jgi:hypothetical protein
LQVLDNFGCQNSGVRQIGRIAQTVIPEPEDVEIGFIAFDQVLVGEAPEALSFTPLVPIPGVVAANKVVQIAASKGIRLQGEVLVGAEIIDPKRARPWRLAGLRSKKSTLAFTPWA